MSIPVHSRVMSLGGVGEEKRARLWRERCARGEGRTAGKADGGVYPSGAMPQTQGNQKAAAPSPHPRIVEPLCAVFRRKLKSEGLKYTPERAHVLDTIVRLDELFEADTIIERVKNSDIRVSKATVYRTIKLLQEAGIIQRCCATKTRPATSWPTAQPAGTDRAARHPRIITISSGELAAACAISARAGPGDGWVPVHIFAARGATSEPES